jgi:hypothetical protein
MITVRCRMVVQVTQEKADLTENKTGASISEKLDAQDASRDRKHLETGHTGERTDV